MSTYKYYISLERSFHSASAGVCCLKIHVEMAEKSPNKIKVLYSLVPLYVSKPSHILTLNMDLFRSQNTQNGG